MGAHWNTQNTSKYTCILMYFAYSNGPHHNTATIRGGGGGGDGSEREREGLGLRERSTQLLKKNE